MKLWLACSAFALLAPLAPEKLVFGPKESTKLEKRFEMGMQLEKRSMTMSVDGNDLPEAMTKDTVMEVESKQTVVVVDEYRKVEDGRPMLLARKFDALAETENQSMKMPGMPEPQDKTTEKKSELTGHTVLFRWDDEKSEYGPEWEGDGPDDELLAGLEEDMDLRGLLPEKPVSEGDSWELDIETFGKLLSPGGELGIDDEDDKEEDEDDEFEKNLKGEARCTFQGVKEVDGRKLARISAVCKATTHQEEENEDGQTVHMAFEMELEGEFLWDLEGKHLASFEMDGDVTARMEMRQSMDIGGAEHKLLITMELGGRMELEAEFERK